jgi:hypothetical protein|tara:strand:+ start:372 stop:773 length:402 start_codon:yes stop_codon:yes gene_type:complete
MVWSQYVDEANIGFDAYISDDDEFNNEHTPLNIEDWEVEYSEELWYMWNSIRTLMDDAHVEHSGQFCDFVEFCYKEHDSGDNLDVHSENEELIDYIWKRLRRIVIDNGFHEEMMRGATFYHFVDFYKKYMCIY